MRGPATRLSVYIGGTTLIRRPIPNDAEGSAFATPYTALGAIPTAVATSRSTNHCDRVGYIASFAHTAIVGPATAGPVATKGGRQVPSASDIVSYIGVGHALAPGARPARCEHGRGGGNRCCRARTHEFHVGRVVLANGRGTTTAVVSNVNGLRIVTRSRTRGLERASAALRGEEWIVRALACAPVPLPAVLVFSTDRVDDEVQSLTATQAGQGLEMVGGVHDNFGNDHRLSPTRRPTTRIVG